jgi:hypothetical protein
LLNGFSKPGQINPGCLRVEVATTGHPQKRIAGAPNERLVPGASFAFGNPDQAIAGDEQALGGLGDVTKGDQLGQMWRRYVGIRGGNRDFDQGGELFGRQKLWRVDGHR